MELCPCPECGLPAEVVTDAVVGTAGSGAAAGAGAAGAAGDVGAVGAEGVAAVSGAQLVGVRCIGRHWFFGLRERLVA